MKVVRLTLVFIILISASCTEDENIFTGDIDGIWELKEISFNGIDGKEINDWISNSITLYLENDNTFFYSYDTGEWSINGDKVILNSKHESMSREYNVLELSDRTLILEIHLTDEQYCCDFDQFTENEVLTIRERFVKKIN